MLPDRVSNPGPLTYESGALPIAQRGPAGREGGQGGGAAPPNNLRGGGGQHTLWPPNNPSIFSFNFYLKQEKITNVPS